MFKDSSFVFSLSKMQGKERRECHSSHPTPEIIKRQNLERSGVSEQLAKEIVKRVTENQEVFQAIEISYRGVKEQKRWEAVGQ